MYFVFRSCYYFEQFFLKNLFFGTILTTYMNWKKYHNLLFQQGHIELVPLPHQMSCSAHLLFLWIKVKINMKRIKKMVWVLNNLVTYVIFLSMWNQKPNHLCSVQTLNKLHKFRGIHEKLSNPKYRSISGNYLYDQTSTWEALFKINGFYFLWFFTYRQFLLKIEKDENFTKY